MDVEPILPNSDGQILRFPMKLRKIIDTCETDAIGWNQEGTVVRINKTLFEREYLSEAHRPFQTTSFSSFIRQLNFYGFQKVNQRASLKVSDDSDPVFFDYRHPHFKRNSADLSLVQRKNKSRRPQNFEDAFARIIEPSSKSLGTWLPFRKSLSDDIKQLPIEGTLKKMPQIQLYMVGSDGVLVPVETAVVLSTSHYSTQDAQAESFTPVLHST